MARTFNADPLYANLEQDGEDAVRTSYAAGRYDKDARKKRLVADWLDRKDRERELAIRREEIDAARDAADAARKTNQKVNIWIAIAAVTAIAAIIGLYLQWNQTSGS